MYLILVRLFIILILSYPIISIRIEMKVEVIERGLYRRKQMHKLQRKVKIEGERNNYMVCAVELKRNE